MAADGNCGETDVGVRASVCKAYQKYAASEACAPRHTETRLEEMRAFRLQQPRSINALAGPGRSIEALKPKA